MPYLLLSQGTKTTMEKIISKSDLRENSRNQNGSDGNLNSTESERKSRERKKQIATSTWAPWLGVAGR